MIRLVSEEDYPRFTGLCSANPIYGNIILANWEAFRDDWHSYSFWIGEDEDNKPCYALFRAWNSYIIASNQALSDFVLYELSQFFALQPPDDILGSSQATKPLNQYLKMQTHSSVSMQRQGQPLIADESAFSQIRPCQGLVAFYLLAAESFDYFRRTTIMDRWVCDLFQKKRQGSALVYELIQDEQIVCCAILICASDSHYATISTLSTRPHWRNKGIGSTMVRFLCKTAEEMGRTVCLDCGEPALSSFYSKFGFQITNDWTILEIDSEK